MGVVALNGFRTEPGGLADHMAGSAEALEHLHRLDIAAVALQPVTGSDVGTIATVMNFASNADYVASLQRVRADEGWQEFWLRVASQGAAVPVETTVLQDLDPGFTPSPDRPMGALLGIQWRSKPGRMADFIGNVMEAVPHIERMGGAVRVMQSLMGTHPMTTMVSTSFADLDAYGEYADRAATDEQWQAFWGGVMADPTADVVRSGLYMNMAG